MKVGEKFFPKFFKAFRDSIGLPLFSVLTICIVILSTILNIHSLHKHHFINQNQKKKKSEFIKLPRQSFFFVNKTIGYNICREKKNSINCIRAEAGSTGSSFAIHTADGGTYFLTAGHVCGSDDVFDTFADMIEEEDLKKEIKLATDINWDLEMTLTSIHLDILHPIIVNIDHAIDSCLLFVPNVKLPIIEPATRATKIGEVVYNIAAPAGMFNYNMVPVFKGIYNGYMYEEQLAYIADVYSIPAMGGSSGSPVLNSDNKFIGMIVAAHSNFENVSFSPHATHLFQYLSNVLEKFPTCELKNVVKPR